MTKTMIEPPTKKRPGDIIMLANGYRQVKRGGKQVPWTPPRERQR